MSRSLSATEMAVLVSLLDGPKFPEKEFIRSGYSFAEVYAMAAWLRTYFAGPGKAEKTVCLAAENRGIIAASLLASLAGGPVLLLPFAFSGQALAGIQKATGFQTAIADTTRALPSGTKVICPQSATSPPMPPTNALSPESELLKIFTGGTTAMPQVWSKTAANIFQEALFLAGWLGITENDCIVATISSYHIYGLLFSIALPLVSSATVLDNTPSFPGEIIKSVQEESCTLLVSVPAHYRALRGKKTSAGTLRLAVSSAGMLEKADNDDFARQNRVDLVEIYGATETGGIASRNRFLGEEQFTVFPAVEWKISGRRLSVRSPYISPDASCDELGFFLTGDRVKPFGEKSFSLQGR
ncbi:MAG TPA: acyl-CoA synthetase, partial [Desulfobacteraceae bacterium]|nr:acyl-CoA synthetase [Desulfobacteraceae bacterium]